MIGPLMLDDVVDLEPTLHHPTSGALIRLVSEHLLTQVLPRLGVVGATMMGVPGTVPTHDEEGTPWLRAVLHVLGA